MSIWHTRCAALALAAAGGASAQAPAPVTLGDLKQPVALSRDELQQLLPGAEMKRQSQRNITQRWTHKPDGTFYISSINTNGRPFNEKGEWSINEQGQYCLSIPWHHDSPERWCRFIVKTVDGYFVVNGMAPTDRARKLEIGGK
jgi:hypothetical protein